VIHTGIELLTFLGQHLDFRPHGLHPWKVELELKMAGMASASVREVLIASWLKVRNKRGRLVRLRPNRAQQEYERHCGERNIILKARQMGMSTWIAARFFIHTITRPGTLSVQVAHDQRSAEEIFRIVHRFLENLPEAVAARDIVDEQRFKDGLAKVIDGTVQCLNASVWTKAQVSTGKQ
jgi:hypothetical protein